MAMIALVDQTEVKARAGGGGMELAGVDAALGRAVISAQTALSGILDTSLMKATRVDVFYLDADYNCMVPNGIFHLRLKQAFASITSLKVGSTLSTITETLDPALSFLRADLLERGYVSVSDELKGKYIEVTYEAGFDADNLDEVPDWLKEAIYAYIPAVLKMTATPPQGSQKESPAAMAKVAMEHANNIMLPFNRRLGFALQPAF